MGIQYFDDTWLVRRSADEPWPAAATAADWAGHRTYAAIAATLVAALALMAAPVIVAWLSIAGILK
jgi:hypothetical protein